MERNHHRAGGVHEIDEVDDSARLRQIEHSFDEVAALVKSDVSASQFAERFLRCAVRTVSAAGGALWEPGPAGTLTRSLAINPECLAFADDTEAEARHARLVASALELPQGKIVPPHAAVDADDPAANQTDYSLLLQPLRLGEVPLAVLELYIPPTIEVRRQRAAVEIADSLAELASEFYARDALRREQQQGETLLEFDEFVRQIHQPRKPGPTSLAIVNQARRFLNCDRVSVVLRSGRRFHLQAVSGAESVNRRSNTARRLEDLATCVISQGAAFYTADAPQTQNAILIQAFDRYLDESPTSDLAVLPLGATSEAGSREGRSATGALIVENFQERLPASLRPRADLVRKHSAIALESALFANRRLVRSFLSRFWFSKTTALLLLLAGIVACLVFIPGEFVVEARGKLEPQTRRDIFAPNPGIVRTIHVAHSQQVGENDVLVSLESPALDLEYERVKGEAQTVRKRLSALEAARGTQSAVEAGTSAPGLLVAQQEELKERLANLELQQKLIETQRQSLVLRSPIQGEVITWKPDDLLKDRPVERGQRVLTVASPQGPWTIDLLIPDNAVGHVLDATKEMGTDLEVTYLLATDPNRTLVGKIRSIAPSAEMYEDHQQYVLATVEVDGNAIPAKRPGTTVFASIHCGRRSLGYIWLRELIEAFQRRLLL